MNLIMRERTTWNRGQIKSAAMQRTADPYAMNQDHLSQQPKPDKYITGDPSTFAEDVTEPNTWEKEYAGGTTKRNEIGQAEYRSETFNHAEKTASLDDATLYKKAELCSSVAKLMLRGRKFASENAFESAVEDQAVSLMHMPNADLVATAARLANEEQGEEQEPEQAQDKGEQGQAGPGAQQAGQQDQEQQASAPVGGMSQQAVEKMVQDAVAKCMQQQAGQPQQGQGQGQGGPGGQMAADYDSHKGPAVNPPGYGPYNGPQTPKLAGKPAARKAGEQDQQQGQQQQAQAGQQDQQQGQQQQAQAGQQDQQQEQQAGQQQDQGQEGQQMQQQADDALLDEMLMGPDGGAPAEMEIEMDAPSMDVGEVGLDDGDEVLKSLFANDESEQAQQAQEAPQGQKQAMSRTASTRTVGTRPTGGVSRVGGAPQGRSGGGGDEANRLAAMWQSAPDVRDAFNMK